MAQNILEKYKTISHMEMDKKLWRIKYSILEAL